MAERQVCGGSDRFQTGDAALGGHGRGARFRHAACEKRSNTILQLPPGVSGVCFFPFQPTQALSLKCNPTDRLKNVRGGPRRPSNRSGPRAPRGPASTGRSPTHPAVPPEAFLPRMSPRPAARKRVVTRGRPIRASDQNSTI